MPIYEYLCSSCNLQYQRLILTRTEEEEVGCPRCGRKGKKRLISRVAYHVSEQDRLDAYRPQDSRDDAFFKDSRNIGLSAKKRAQDLGVDLGKGFDEKLEKLRTDPSSVIKDSE
jgi:putative FmdB family regulatory protein